MSAAILSLPKDQADTPRAASALRALQRQLNRVDPPSIVKAAAEESGRRYLAEKGQTADTRRLRQVVNNWPHGSYWREVRRRARAGDTLVVLPRPDGTVGGGVLNELQVFLKEAGPGSVRVILGSRLMPLRLVDVVELPDEAVVTRYRVAARLQLREAVA